MSITADNESAVVEAGPDPAVHRRRVARRGRRRDARRRGPVDRRDARRGRRRDARRRRRPRSTPRGGAGRVGGAPAARARRDPAPRVRGDERARRRPGAADDARDGQAARRVQGRDRLRRRVLPLVLRGGGADRGPLRDRAERRRPADHDEAAGRPVLRDHAVELPDGDGHAQDRPGGRRRLHDGRQAGAADAALDARAGPDPRGGRACRPACST